MLTRFTRPLVLASLIYLLQHVSIAQEPASVRYSVPENCPVTKSPVVPFIPPLPYTAKISTDAFLYGTDELWTILPKTGTWSGLPHYTPDDPTYRQKLFWWRQGLDRRVERQPKLKVIGRRLDSPSPTLMVDDANTGWTNDQEQAFMVTGINLPTLGCWEITGHYAEYILRYVIWVTQ